MIKMKVSPLMFVLIFLFISNYTCAQTTNKGFMITGNVHDSSNNKAIQNVTVIVQSRNDSNTTCGTNTDEKGYFNIKGIRPRNIRVKLSCLGYQTKIVDSIALESISQLGIIRLKPTQYILPELLIKTIKPMIENQVGKQVINIDQVPGNTGSVTDILSNSGIVNVDQQTNAIKVRGQDVVVQIDGHPFELSNNVLAQMSASMFEQAEVITSPTARESAESGSCIINLISKKSQFDNLNGSISFSPSTNKQNMIGTNIGYKENKINVFGSVLGYFGEYQWSNAVVKENYNSANYHMLNSFDETDVNGYLANLKFGMDYKIDNNNSMTFYGTYNNLYNKNRYTSYSNVKNKDDELQKSYQNVDNSIYKYQTYSLYAYYKRKLDSKGNEITADIQYAFRRDPSSSDMSTIFDQLPGYPALQKTETQENAHTLYFKSSYTLPTGIGRFETGYQFTFRDRKNDYSALNYSYLKQMYQDSLKFSNIFKYRESIHAVYISYVNNFGKFNMIAGFRMEDLLSKGTQFTIDESFSESYLNLFPSFTITYNFNDKYWLSFDASRKVRYPNMYALNPFKKQNAPNDYYMGNPKIQPYFTNSCGLSFSNMLITYYSYTTGQFEYTLVNEQDSITYNLPINLSSNSLFGAEVNLPYNNSPEAFFQMPDFVKMISINLGYNYFKKVGMYGKDDLSDWGSRKWVNINLGVILWYDVNANLSFNYSPKQENKRYLSNETKSLSLNFGKNISIHNQKLQLRLSISDLLNTRTYRNTTYGGDFMYRSIYTPYNSRSISIGITYMYNDYRDRRDTSLDDGRDTRDR